MPLLNLKEADRNLRVYRIIQVERLYELFADRVNVLVSPKRWEDPFENFILESPVELPSGEIGQFGFHHDFFGQCWTLNRASDAMWRIYSSDKAGIRMRSTIGKLIDSLAAVTENRAVYKAHIGRVRYARRSKLEKVCEDGVEMLPDGSGLAATLLWKRLAFAHEREVRLLYLADTGESVPNGLFKYSVDPHVLIDQLMTDPRLSAKDARKLIADIRARTGFGGVIKRSLLYGPPKDFVTRMRMPWNR